MKNKMKKLITNKATKITGVLVLILMFSFATAFYTNDIDAQKANSNDTLISNQNSKEEVDVSDELADIDEETAESSENASASTNQESKDNSKGKNNSNNSSNSTNKPASSSNSSKPASKPAPSKPAPSKPAPTCSTKTINHPAEYKTVKGSPAVYEKQTWFLFSDGTKFINDGRAANNYAADTGQNYSMITKNVEVKPAVPDKKVLVKEAWTETVKVCN